jgi:hypothetical protein
MPPAAYVASTLLSLTHLLIVPSLKPAMPPEQSPPLTLPEFIHFETRENELRPEMPPVLSRPVTVPRFEQALTSALLLPVMPPTQLIPDICPDLLFVQLSIRPLLLPQMPPT